MSTPRYLAIAGNIGSGKTTLTNLLAKRYGWRPYYEEVLDNPYLADFYGDMRRYALPLQLRFLAHRARDVRRITSSSESAIQDRTIYEDAEIFARNLYVTGKMDERDYTTYREISELFFSELRAPDVIVYLKMSVPRLLARIAERGRPYEKSISGDYLSTLNDRYEAWSVAYPYGTLITIEADQIDPRHSEADLRDIARLLQDALGQQTLFGEL
jgi:deoxyadenosine/deoxycytidine kinase